MDHNDIFTHVRLAGEVARYHCYPVLRSQSVGEHTWQIMRIWFQIWGPMPPEVSTHIMFHDAKELMTGDIPFQAKRAVPELAHASNRAEKYAAMVMKLPTDLLPDDLHLKFKICDLLEMFEYGLEEMMRGNQYGEPIIRVTHFEIAKRLLQLEDDDYQSVTNFMSTVYMRYASHPAISKVVEGL